MDAGERALLEETVRDAIASVPTDSGGAPALDAVLADLGWLEMLEAEPRDATEIVFSALGASNGVATVLDDVLVSALGAEPRDDLAVLLPRYSTWDAPGTIDGRHLDAVGLMTARAATASEVVVACRAGAESQMAVVSMAGAEVTPVRGADPDGGLHVVRIEHGDAESTALDAAAWEAAVASGQRAVAHQISGASHAMLDLARTHAVERVQFGRVISRFQAVRHRLAEALVAIEALDASLAAAWDEGSPLTAAMAKAVAGRTARTVAAQCQQVLAGIGFTTDHAFHRYLKRTMALEGLFGSADEIAVEVGRQLLATRSAPTLIEL
jgi:hypothetical protein